MAERHGLTAEHGRASEVTLLPGLLGQSGEEPSRPPRVAGFAGERKRLLCQGNSACPVSSTPLIPRDFRQWVERARSVSDLAEEGEALICERPGPFVVAHEHR